MSGGVSLISVSIVLLLLSSCNTEGSVSRELAEKSTDETGAVPPSSPLPCELSASEHKELSDAWSVVLGSHFEERKAEIFFGKLKEIGGGRCRNIAIKLSDSSGERVLGNYDAHSKFMISFSVDGSLYEAKDLSFDQVMLVMRNE